MSTSSEFERAELADRHTDTLGGRLAALDAVAPTSVCIVVSQHAAQTRSGQLIATFVANLLGRIEGVVQSIQVLVEGSDPLLFSSIDPRDRYGASCLSEAVLRNGALSSAGRVVGTGEPGTTIYLGIGRPAKKCQLYASASEWGAYIGSGPGPEVTGHGEIAVGAIVAASFAAAEVFRSLRGRGALATLTSFLCFDVWEWKAMPAQADSDAGVVEAVFARIDRNAGVAPGLPLPAFTLVGLGAVGCAFMLTLWASRTSVRATIIDRDVVARSNLNRYTLFSLEDLKHLKVDRAKTLLAGENFELNARPVWWSEYARVEGSAAGAEPVLISAVDTNTARHQLQDALPGLILGASTHELRVEVGRYALSDEKSRCLKCFNEPEATEDDLALKRRLMGMESEELEQYARERDVSVHALFAFVDDLRKGGDGCALLGGETLNKLRLEGSQRQFAVSFVSSLGGALLAAQFFREAAGRPLLIPPNTRAVFQLWRPGAVSNSLYAAPRQPRCWCESPDVRMVHRQTWIGQRLSKRSGANDDDALV